jgi:uncharacterized protein HemY
MPDAPHTLIALGYQARREERLEDAERYFAQAAEFSRDTGDRAGLGQSLTGLGQIERDRKNSALALQHYRDAANI